MSLRYALKPRFRLINVHKSPRFDIFLQQMLEILRGLDTFLSFRCVLRVSAIGVAAQNGPTSVQRRCARGVRQGHPEGFERRTHSVRGVHAPTCPCSWTRMPHDVEALLLSDFSHHVGA
jgi:hypothetical protein